MADNVILNLGSGGQTISTEDVSGTQICRSKICLGAANVDGGNVSLSNPLPCITTLVSGSTVTLSVGNTVAATQSGTWNVTNAGTFAVQAALAAGSTVTLSTAGSTVTLASSAVTNAGTFAVQAAQSGTWNVTNAGTFAVQAALAAGSTVTLASTNVTNAGTFAVQASLANGSTVTLSSNAVTLASTDITNAGVFAVQAALNAGSTVTLSSNTVTLASTNVTNVGTFAVQAALAAGSTVTLSTAGSTVTLASSAITNAGTFATQDSQVIADDAAFTVATSKVFPVGYLADETATDSVDEGDIGAARMTLDRKIHVVAELESASMRVSGTSVLPKYAAVAASTAGDNSLVSAVSGKKIRVLSMMIIAGAAGNIYFTSSAAGTTIFGGSTNKINLAANGGFCLPFSPVGWFENSSTNQALVMNASSTGPFSGGLTYIEV